MCVDELILKAIKKIDVSDEMKLLELDFSVEFNPQKLQSKLDILQTIFNPLNASVTFI